MLPEPARLAGHVLLDALISVDEHIDDADRALELALRRINKGHTLDPEIDEQTEALSVTARLPPRVLATSS